MLYARITKQLRDFELDVEISVEKGETLVLIGENGAGKSTLLNILSGLADPDEGEIKLGKKLIFSHTDKISTITEERNTGHLFQSYALFPHLSVFENVAFGLRCRNVQKKAVDELVSEQLAAMQMKELSNVNVKKLSGGQKQRVALARALVLKPQILLLDEPLSAVDVRMQAEMRRELRRRIKEANIPCIVVTHTLKDALELGDSVAIIEKGEIIQKGKPQDIFKNPACGFVARFTGMENLFKGEADGNAGIDLGPFRLHAPTDLRGPVLAGIRAEEIIFSCEEIDTSARNMFKGIITDIQWNGALFKIVVDTGVLITGLVTQKSMEHLDLFCGQEIYVIFKASAVRVFPV